MPERFLRTYRGIAIFLLNTLLLCGTLVLLAQLLALLEVQRLCHLALALLGVRLSCLHLLQLSVLLQRLLFQQQMLIQIQK